MRRHLAGLVLCSVFAAGAGGQTISGTYTTTPAQAGATPVTLVLQKDPQGKVTGSLSGNGVSYAVLGEMQGEDVLGSLSGGGMRSYFEAHREGAQLRVIMADTGPDGKPDYAKARELMFWAVAGAGASASGIGATTGPSGRPAQGNPLASGAAADKFTGTFASTDVTLSLKREGAGYAGVIRYRGDDYPATARATGETLAGSFKAGGQSYEITIASAGDGKFVNLTTGGTTYMLARSGSGGANPLASAGAAPPPSGGMGRGASAQDQQIANLLTSTAWCTFSYSGSSTYSGTSSGTSRSSRTVFTPDGLVTEVKNGETVNSGSNGAAYGGNSNAQQGRWKIENGQLMLSANGVQWVLQPTKIADNGNGYPIITTAGKEYMMCK